MANKRSWRAVLGLGIAMIAWLFTLCSAKEAPTPVEGTTAPNVESEVERTAWFREAKFGMFIHWGPYSLASVEASWPIMNPDPKRPILQDEYVTLYKRFNPTQFDPKAWVNLAKEAGQRYMVFTTKHHDGFCMFDSALTDYKITNTPYGKDVARMLAAAAREEKMPLGFYYSPPDMHHPGYRDTSKLVKDTWRGDPQRPEWGSFLNYMEGHLRELLTHYGPIVLIWFDAFDKTARFDPPRFFKLVHELQPACLINDRLGLPGDFASGGSENHVPEGTPTKGGVVSKTAPAPEDFRLWEECMTINDTWAYNKYDRHFKSVKQLVQTLVDVASKGGNFLLDVGPTPEGTIQPEFVDRLRAMGKWLKVNGASIYGTTYGPLQDLPFGKTTAKGNTIYLHVFDWPAKPQLEINGLKRQVTNVTVLATGKRLKFDQAREALNITIPAKALDPYDTVLALETR